MNIFKKTISAGLLIVIAGSFLSIKAQAEERAAHGPPPFAEFDQDGSGFVSEEEFNTVRGQHMAARAAEGKQMRCAASAPAFADIDTDGDGQLSQDELAAGHEAHKGKCRDMNHGHGSDHKAGHHGGKGQCECKGEGECKCRGKNGNNMPTFADFDLDGDGKIVEQEFNEAHTKKMSEMAAEGHQMKHADDAPGFSGIDTNGDGEISQDEFATHQAGHHQQMHHDKEKQDH